MKHLDEAVSDFQVQVNEIDDSLFENNYISPSDANFLREKNKKRTLKALDQMVDLIDNMPEDELFKLVFKHEHAEHVASLHIYSPEFLRLT